MTPTWTRYLYVSPPSSAACLTINKTLTRKRFVLARLRLTATRKLAQATKNATLWREAGYAARDLRMKALVYLERSGAPLSSFTANCAVLDPCAKADKKADK